MARIDGLPEPVSVTDLYLAEILKELRGAKPPVAPAEETHVKEPEPQPRKKK